METTNLQASTPTQPSSSTRNLKSWFDEFRAKVSKKAATQSSEPVVVAATSAAAAAAEDTTTTATASTTATPSSSSSSSQPPTVATATKSPKDVQAAANVQGPSPGASSTTASTKAKVAGKGTNSSLRARKVAKFSLTDSPDFDTASIRTIFNRRDSRYEASTRRHRASLFSRIISLIIGIISYLIPFNYNLPWKLFCLINSSIVIIVIGIANDSSQTSAFTFMNGFVSGLAVAIVCFAILTLSFMLQMIPKSQTTSDGTKEETNAAPATPTRASNDESCSASNILSSETFDDSMKKPIVVDSTCSEQRSDNFSLFEILGDVLRTSTDRQEGEQEESKELEDDNYKGWMIEFIGDYEQRNTADIKLKSIFVRIEDRMLYLCKPKSNHDADSTSLPVFANQRVFDLNKARKFSACLLIPKTVRNKQKYVWSKKYPIRLEFLDVQETNGTNDIAAKGPEITKFVQLTLFAKSCREKEEWFRRFKRIIEENRLNLGQSNRRCSIKSEQSTGSESINESFFGSLKRFRRRSPSPKARDGVQTSQSSHLLIDPHKSVDDGGDNSSQAEAKGSHTNLARTKSCEALPSDQGVSVSGDNDQERSSEDGNEQPNSFNSLPADDSTLTRETADLFSQAVEYSNFIESQPTLNYKEYIERVIESGQEATSSSDWFNALTGRIFYDVFSHNYWSVWFKRKIQRKLYRIRLPYFMETLTLTKIDLGTNAPQFFNVVSHSFDSYGLSIDFDMAYSGGLTMTFETKLNLLKIKSDNASTAASNNSSASAANVSSTSSNQTNSNSGASSGADIPSSAQSASQQQQQQQNQEPSPSSLSSASSSPAPNVNLAKDNSSASESSLMENLKMGDTGNKSSTFSSSGSTRTSGDSTSSDSNDSDSSSSSDSSFDEAEANEISDWEDYGAEKTRQNIVKFVDRIASSRYFQHATENRYIKKKLQDISNCPLVLVVQIQSLNGILTLNVPPPQTDRIWYGFKPTPELNLKALPKMGDREVNLSHVTDWIERKLAEEFKKILVIPNMEDFVLPVLKSDHLQYVTATR